MSFKKTGEVQEVQEIYCSCGEKLPKDCKTCPKCRKDVVPSKQD